MSGAGQQAVGVWAVENEVAPHVAEVAATVLKVGDDLRPDVVAVLEDEDLGGTSAQPRQLVAICTKMADCHRREARRPLEQEGGGMLPPVD